MRIIFIVASFLFVFLLNGQNRLNDRYHTYDDIIDSLFMWDENFSGNNQPSVYYPNSGIIYQLEEIRLGITKAEPNDIIIISDLDEIPNLEKVNFEKIKLPSAVDRFLNKFVDSMKSSNLNRIKRSAILYKVINASGMSVQQLMADIAKIKKELK